MISELYLFAFYWYKNSSPRPLHSLPRRLQAFFDWNQKENGLHNYIFFRVLGLCFFLSSSSKCFIWFLGFVSTEETQGRIFSWKYRRLEETKSFARRSKLNYFVSLCLYLIVFGNFLNFLVVLIVTGVVQCEAFLQQGKGLQSEVKSKRTGTPFFLKEWF